jgi:hypothetical protein
VTNCFGRDDDAATPSDAPDAPAARQIVALGAVSDALARSIACLAHDFNNVLTIVMGNLSALEPHVDADLADRHVDPAMRACRRAADIARRLTELALPSGIESNDAGDDTRVCLLTPPVERGGRDTAHSPERRELVLIVGGDDETRGAHRRDLVEDGFGVLEARDASEAQALLAAIEEIGAVVLDAPPGDAMGRAVADRAREVRPDVAIVSIARASEPPSLSDGVIEGAVVVTAPVTRAELTQAIARGRHAHAPRT